MDGENEIYAIAKLAPTLLSSLPRSELTSKFDISKDKKAITKDSKGRDLVPK